MILDIIQIASGILMMIAILLQNRGSGLGAAFGGGENIYSARRDFEKNLFYFTIIIAVVFFISTLINVLY